MPCLNPLAQRRDDDVVVFDQRMAIFAARPVGVRPGEPTRRTRRPLPELIGSLKLGNVWVFVELIFGPRWPMHQLNKNQNIA